MCGIAGIHALREPVAEDVAFRSVQMMMRAMRHRGPDGDGIYQNQRTCFGHVRLSILDLDGGAQPIFNEDQTVVVTYNGELYGFSEQRKALEQRHTFRTRTDTEMLVHLYEEVGEALTDHLNGMYAFGLLDRTRDAVLLAVDPLGIKPLYYHQSDQLLVFASELRALLTGMQALGFETEHNIESFRQFLTCGWIAAPETPIEGVRKLAPGQSLLIRGVSTTFSTKLLAPETASPLDEVEHLDQTLRAVLRDQLVADVDVGLLLSGGVDSSLLASIACSIGFRPKTFSVEFSGEAKEVRAVNEARFAEVVAQHLGTEHHTTQVNSKVLMEDLDDALEAMDEPISDPALLPLLRVSRFARGQVKACLTGDGGDELFGGYLRHLVSPIKQSYQRLPEALRLLASSMATGGKSRHRHSWVSRTFGRLSAAYELVASPEYIVGPFGWRHTHWLTQPSQQSTCEVKGDYLAQDLYGQLAGQMLPKTDRITMRCGLEARVPFLDNRVVRLAMRLPRSSKVRGLTTKVILRKLLARYMPAEIVYRKKQGFRVPLSEWFRTDLRSELRDRVLGGLVIPEEVIARSSVECIVRQHLDGEAEHSNRLWALLVLNTWIGLGPDDVSTKSFQFALPGGAQNALDSSD